MKYVLAEAANNVGWVVVVPAIASLVAIVVAISALIRKPTDKLEARNKEQDEMITEIKEEVASLKKDQEHDHDWLKRVSKDGKALKRFIHDADIKLALIMQKLQIKMPDIKNLDSGSSGFNESEE